jgi:hypothetical protein
MLPEPEMEEARRSESTPSARTLPDPEMLTASRRATVMR